MAIFRSYLENNIEIYSALFSFREQKTELKRPCPRTLTEGQIGASGYPGWGKTRLELGNRATENSGLSGGFLPLSNGELIERRQLDNLAQVQAGLKLHDRRAG